MPLILAPNPVQMGVKNSNSSHFDYKKSGRNLIWNLKEFKIFARFQGLVIESWSPLTFVLYLKVGLGILGIPEVPPELSPCAHLRTRVIVCIRSVP